MTVPLWVILIPYALYGALFTVFALVDCYHVAKFGTFGIANFVAVAIFLTGTTFLLSTTATLLAPVDWVQPIVSGLSVDLLTTPSPL